MHSRLMTVQTGDLGRTSIVHFTVPLVHSIRIGLESRTSLCCGLILHEIVVRLLGIHDCCFCKANTWCISDGLGTQWDRLAWQCWASGLVFLIHNGTSRRDEILDSNEMHFRSLLLTFAGL